MDGGKFDVGASGYDVDYCGSRVGVGGCVDVGGRVASYVCSDYGVGDVAFVG